MAWGLTSPAVTSWELPLEVWWPASCNASLKDASNQAGAAEELLLLIRHKIAEHQNTPSSQPRSETLSDRKSSKVLRTDHVSQNEKMSDALISCKAVVNFQLAIEDWVKGCRAVIGVMRGEGGGYWKFKRRLGNMLSQQAFHLDEGESVARKHECRKDSGRGFSSGHQGFTRHKWGKNLRLKLLVTSYWLALNAHQATIRASATVISLTSSELNAEDKSCCDMATLYLLQDCSKGESKMFLLAVRRQQFHGLSFVLNLSDVADRSASLLFQLSFSCFCLILVKSWSHSMLLLIFLVSQLLLLKIGKLEQLLQLKDAKIKGLIFKLEHAQGTIESWELQIASKIPPNNSESAP